MLTDLVMYVSLILVELCNENVYKTGLRVSKTWVNRLHEVLKTLDWSKGDQRVTVFILHIITRKRCEFIKNTFGVLYLSVELCNIQLVNTVTFRLERKLMKKLWAISSFPVYILYSINNKNHHFYKSYIVVCKCFRIGQVYCSSILFQTTQCSFELSHFIITDTFHPQIFHMEVNIKTHT